MLRTSRFYSAVEEAVRAGLGQYGLGDAVIMCSDHDEDEKKLVISVEFDEGVNTFEMEAPPTVDDVPETLPLGEGGEKTLGIDEYHLKVENLETENIPDVYTVKSSSFERAAELVLAKLFEEIPVVRVAGFNYDETNAGYIREHIRRAHQDEIPRVKKAYDLDGDNLVVGFAIYTSDQGLIEDNAGEELSQESWDAINSFIPTMEQNVMKELESNFGIRCRSEGHSGDELIGTCWISLDNKDGLEYIFNHGRDSYGNDWGEPDDDWLGTATKGINDAEADFVGISVQFFDLPSDEDYEDLKDIAENRPDLNILLDVMRGASGAVLAKKAGFKSTGDDVKRMFSPEKSYAATPTFHVADAISNPTEMETILEDIAGRENIDAELETQDENEMVEAVEHNIEAAFKSAGLKQVMARLVRAEWKDISNGRNLDAVVELSTDEAKTRFAVQASFDTTRDLKRLVFNATRTAQLLGIKTYEVDLDEGGTYRISALDAKYAAFVALNELYYNSDEDVEYGESIVNDHTIRDVAEQVVDDGRVSELTNAALELDPIRNAEDYFGSPWITSNKAGKFVLDRRG